MRGQVAQVYALVDLLLVPPIVIGEDGFALRCSHARSGLSGFFGCELRVANSERLELRCEIW